MPCTLWTVFEPGSSSKKHLGNPKLDSSTINVEAQRNSKYNKILNC